MRQRRAAIQRGVAAGLRGMRAGGISCERGDISSSSTGARERGGVMSVRQGVTIRATVQEQMAGCKEGLRQGGSAVAAGSAKAPQRAPLFDSARRTRSLAVVYMRRCKLAACRLCSRPRANFPRQGPRRPASRSQAPLARLLPQQFCKSRPRPAAARARPQPTAALLQ